ncbi:MAG: NAD(P)-dependent oxidoreductase [Acidiferrobacterales bacterium]
MSSTRHIVYPDAEENLSKLITGERLARLEAMGRFAIYYGRPSRPEELIERIGDASAVVSGWGMSNDVLRATKNVQIISFTGFGVGTFIDVEEAARLGITVTHTLSTAETIAEHTMALMLAAARNITRLDRETRTGGWNTELPGFDLRGKTLGLIGFGRIAQQVVPLAQAFGMRVIAWTRNPDAERVTRFGIEFTDIDNMLTESDVLSLHLPFTPETEGLLTAERLRNTKPGVVIVNTARARILDESAMIELLASGHIAAAGLDVFSEEPLPPGHPLTTLDNVALTPHCGYNTPEANAALIDIAIDNLEAFFDGNPTNVATPS